MVALRRAVVFLLLTAGALAGCDDGETVLVLTINQSPKKVDKMTDGGTCVTTDDAGTCEQTDAPLDAVSIRVTISRPAGAAAAAPAPLSKTYEAPVRDGATAALFYRRITLDSNWVGRVEITAEGLDANNKVFAVAKGVTASVVEGETVAAAITLEVTPAEPPTP